MDKSSNVNGSNPEVSVSGSNPAMNASGSNPSMNASGSNPAMSIQASNPSFNVSDPSLRVQYSDPSLSSISGVHASSSKVFVICLSSLLVVTLVVLALGVVHILNEAKAQKAEKAQKESEASNVRFVNAQLTRQLDELGAGFDSSDDVILMSLFTTPEGADVYEEGVFIGTTPIEDRKYAKSLEDHNLVIMLDGYAIERRLLDLENNFSDAIDLQPIVVEEVKERVREVAEEKPKENTGGIMVNQARVVGSATANTGSKKTTKKDKDKKAETEQPQFVLPE